jgi:saccharopine dehydrogenase-like NADP-dependent oxidoreductase
VPLQKIAVLGLGKVGTLAAKLLHAGGFDVTGFDSRAPHEKLPFALKAADVGSDDGVRAATHGFDAVLSCLPYRINKRIAAAAHERGMHYFDLTEDVPRRSASSARLRAG